MTSRRRYRTRRLSGSRVCSPHRAPHGQHVLDRTSYRFRRATEVRAGLAMSALPVRNLTIAATGGEDGSRGRSRHLKKSRNWESRKQKLAETRGVRNLTIAATGFGNGSSGASPDRRRRESADLRRRLQRAARNGGLLRTDDGGRRTDILKS